MCVVKIKESFVGILTLFLIGCSGASYHELPAKEWACTKTGEVWVVRPLANARMLQSEKRQGCVRYEYLGIKPEI